MFIDDRPKPPLGYSSKVASRVRPREATWNSSLARPLPLATHLLSARALPLLRPGDRTHRCGWGAALYLCLPVAGHDDYDVFACRFLDKAYCHEALVTLVQLDFSNTRDDCFRPLISYSFAHHEIGEYTH